MKAKVQSEADWKRWMVESCKAHGHYARRIEDQYAVGVLDCIFIVRGHAVFAEVKRYKGNYFEPTPRQYVEMKRIIDAGGNAVLIGCEPGLVSFSPLTKQAHRADSLVRHYVMDFGPFPTMLINYMELYHKCPTIEKSPLVC